MAQLRETLTLFTAILEEAGVDSPRLSSELLLAKALGLERQALLRCLLLRPDEPLSRTTLEKARELLARRAAGEPAAYILGHKEFFSREFAVGPAALIPRPETELLVEEALAYARSSPENARKKFLDLGTGSGCIAVTLALELPAWLGTAVDKSPEALALARENAKILGADTLSFVQADFFAWQPGLGEFSLFAANPPYISEGEYQGLSREVKDYEPRMALISGARGTEHARALLRLAALALEPGGALFLEMGCTQGPEHLELAASMPDVWTGCAVLKDLSGLPRLFSARRSGAVFPASDFRGKKNFGSR